ncbi:MAG: hypothetical protein ACYYKD_07435 [Rhodospirillales bacterium]
MSRAAVLGGGARAGKGAAAGACRRDGAVWRIAPARRASYRRGEMSAENGYNPDRVAEARRALESALDRLERAFAAQAARAPEPEAPGAPDSGAAEAFKKLQRENAHLRAANENAAGRLDSAIGRLEKLLAK